ncbi:Tyrosine aminotransferase [Cryptotermes secundus]|uniref:Tyrosine aminotransferase n=2 Tax=Cryptotermes secundus TaxID=105785 RepID=A0A2J7R2F6_9NEOP|nr:tyrosine aminotransferase isoform X1 [Cryptotermes secundus]XP_033607108.1 tyrosine aminotransferase isoform X1 [Cryptotermes secundus]PNF35002.1 Tyrosine aminotransferase [Cryptotermes secundus]PNF35004.1 Tyrosine aminotransferase [Cryptotermes secundus]
MSPSGVRRQWEVVPSDIAQKTHNPLRNVVENLRLEPNPEKSMIALSIGDPTVFGNLKPPVEVIEAMQESLLSIRYNGYAPSTGHQEAREAVARYSSSAAVTVHSQDVVLCSGCSCALDLAITVLANPGQNILVPRPGFPLYRTLAESLGIHVKSYNLRPERGWEVDTMHLEQQIDASTAALVVSNPSNPCGSVYSRQHLRDILQVARAKFVPVIADEIYEHMVFPGQTFHPLASVSDDVPILACSGITKRFLVPGWRMGWITIHDRHGIFETAGVRAGLQRLSQRILGSNTLVQGALASIFTRTPEKFFQDTIMTLQCHANIAYDMLKGAKGLTPLMPKGAMYMMVGINMAEFPDFASELNFVEQMVTEESVFCLPSKCFDYTNYMRLVLTVPEEQLREACHRITAFCKRYHRPEDADSHKGNTDVVETCTSNCSAALRESRDLIVPKDASISP